jgi:glycosyltransferase involved in cell wall biosynthesis
MDKPAVSVIVCTWNRAATLAATLQSLAGQRGLASDQVEFVVVDNNSTDGTRAMVEGLRAAWPVGELRYLFEPRQGKQFALNRGIAQSRFPVLAFTDDDILFPADWLARVQGLFAESGPQLAGGRTCLSWPGAAAPAWFAPDMMAVVGGVDLGDQRLDPAPPSYSPAGANLVARRELFSRLGAFSELHFRHMDFEFGMRCQRAGARVVYEPTLVVHAPVDAACLSPRYFRRWAFKAGIARDDEPPPARRRGPAVPRWVYRQVVQDALHAAVVGPFSPPAVAFARQFRLWRGLGTVAGAWHAWLRPAQHAGWVESHSQKRKNVY